VLLGVGLLGVGSSGVDSSGVGLLVGHFEGVSS
jgi:hypothetical protein